MNGLRAQSTQQARKDPIRLSAVQQSGSLRWRRLRYHVRDSPRELNASIAPCGLEAVRRAHRGQQRQSVNIWLHSAHPPAPLLKLDST